jgi:hypothetical protein
VTVKTVESVQRYDEADMADLVSVAERLRIVKQARRKFLALWDIERAFVAPLLERVAADVEIGPEGPTTASAAAAVTGLSGRSDPRGQVDRRTRLDDET